jgi:hypothetical protein
MSLIDFIRKKLDVQVATAIPATQDRKKEGSSLRIAGIVKIAVANPTDEKLNILACSWMLALPEGQLLTVYLPAVSLDRVKQDHPTLIRAEITQGCAHCVYGIRPGQTAGGYCASTDRHGQPGPYGAGHPARFLANDGGVACEYFESSETE